MWRRPAKRIWCSECTGLGHTERRENRSEDQGTAIGDGGVNTREMDQVPEVRDRNRRWRGIEETVQESRT